MNLKYSDERDLFARYLVDMSYDGRNSVRNLKWIHRNYARFIFGTSFETFSSYLDYENNPLDDVELPLYLIEGLWRMVNVPRTLDRLSDDLVRKLNSAKYTRGRHGYTRRRESVLWYPDYDIDELSVPQPDCEPEEIRLL